MCSDCAFEPYCGADPTYHHATTGDFLGRKPTSGFCRRNMAIFKLLLDRYEGDACDPGALPNLGRPLIALRGKASERTADEAPAASVWRIVDAHTAHAAAQRPRIHRSKAGSEPPQGFGLYLARSDSQRECRPGQLGHASAGAGLPQRR